MQSPYGNAATSASWSSVHAGDAHNSRRHNPIGPSRTRLANRHNPYAASPSQQDLEGSTLKGQHRNRREGRSTPSTKRSCTTIADIAVATPSGTWAGASQDATYNRFPEPIPVPHCPGRTMPKPEHVPACVSTIPPTTSRLVQDVPLDEFGLYSFLEYEDNYESNFFDPYDLGCSTSYLEQTTTAYGAEKENLQTVSPAATPLPEPARRSAGKIKLSSLHHKVMRSKGYVPDISLDQLDGVIRRQILRQVDQLMFEYQAQSREQRKWRGYREPEDDGLFKRSKKRGRFNPCSTESRDKKRRLVGSGVDELVHRVNRFQLSA